MHTCPSCGSSNIEVDDARGTATCTVCGNVLEDNIIVSEVTFTEEHGVVQQYVDADGHGFSMTGTTFQGLGRSSREVTISNGRKLVQQMASRMQLNDNHSETAVGYYKMALDHKFTQGRPTDHVVASCLYVVCRQEQTSHMLLDFADLLQVNVYKLASCFLKLCRVLHVTLPVVDPVLYIPRFAHLLDFGERSHEVGKTALRIVSRMKRDWIHVGRRPAGVCGAGLLLAARLHGFPRTQRDVISAVRVCCSTLKQRLDEFGDTPSSALTMEEFLSIELEGEADPPAFKRQQKLQQQAIDDGLVREAEELVGTKAFSALDKSAAKLSAGDKSATQSKATAGAGAAPADAQQMAIVPVLADADNQAFDKPWIQPDNDGTLSDVDDEDIDQFLLTDPEIDLRRKIWEENNQAFLEAQQERKAKRAAASEQRSKSKSKRRKKTTRLEASAAPDASIQEMLSKKKSSTKINYDKLNELLPPDADVAQPEPAATPVAATAALAGPETVTASQPLPTQDSGIGQTQAGIVSQSQTNRQAAASASQAVDNNEDDLDLDDEIDDDDDDDNGFDLKKALGYDEKDDEDDLSD